MQKIRLFLPLLLIFTAAPLRADDWFSKLPFKTAYVEYREPYPALEYPPSVSEALNVGIHGGDVCQKLYIDAEKKRLTLLILDRCRKEEVRQVYSEGKWFTYGPEYRQNVAQETDKPIGSTPRIYDRVLEDAQCKSSRRPGKQLHGVDTTECNYQGGKIYLWQQLVLLHEPSAEARGGVTDHNVFYAEKFQAATYLKLNEPIAEEMFFVPSIEGPDYEALHKELEKTARSGQVRRELSIDLLLQMLADSDDRYRAMFLQLKNGGDKQRATDDYASEHARRLREAVQRVGAPAEVVSGSAVVQERFLEQRSAGPEADAETERVQAALARGDIAAALRGIDKLIEFYPERTRLHEFKVRLATQVGDHAKALEGSKQVLLREFYPHQVRFAQHANLLCLTGAAEEGLKIMTLLIEDSVPRYNRTEALLLERLAKEHLTQPEKEMLAAAANDERYSLRSYYEQKAKILLALNQAGEAEKNFRIALELHYHLKTTRPLTTSQMAEMEERARGLERLAFVHASAGEWETVLRLLDEKDALATYLAAKGDDSCQSSRSPLLASQAKRALGDLPGANKSLTEASALLSSWELKRRPDEEQRFKQVRKRLTYSEAGYGKFTSMLESLEVNPPSPQATDILCRLGREGVDFEFRRLEFFQELKRLKQALASPALRQEKCIKDAVEAVDSLLAILRKDEEALFGCAAPLLGK